VSAALSARPDAMPIAGPALLDRLGTAIAVASPDDLSIRFENARFRSWFPAAPGRNGLAGRIPGYDVARAAERFARGRPYRLQPEIRHGPRALPLVVDVHSETMPDGPALLVEAQNITKQREAEHMLDSYSRLVERQTRALEQEKERAERLLLNIMPRTVAAELRDFGTTTPQTFQSASVLMLDFVGFTDMAISRDPGALIAELNDVFTSFDRIAEHCGVERIKTIGDAYMAVAGLPEPDPDHEFHIAGAALRMRRFLERRNASATNRWQCRIGIGTGPLIGSIVGTRKYVYDIFGPAVNLAARIEQACDPMQILISAEHAGRIRDDFVVRPAGIFEIRGFGRQPLWALEDEARRGR
jgi:adenylate cyclase